MKSEITILTLYIVSWPARINYPVLLRASNLKLTTAQDLQSSKCIQDECYRTLKHFCATSLYETVAKFWALCAILNSLEEGSERERGQQNKNTNSFFQEKLLGRKSYATYSKVGLTLHRKSPLLKSFFSFD